MHQQLFQANRGYVAAYSPRPFDELPQARDVAFFHAGWGTHPRHSQKLLEQLEEQGIFPIALDTRYGYAEQGELRPVKNGRFLLNTFRFPKEVSSDNPYFPDASKKANRTNLRRPTATLAIADALGVDAFHAIGHSDGVRTIATVAQHHPDRVRSLTSLNGIGTDPAFPEGMTLRELATSVSERRKERRTRNNTIIDRSPDRTLRERAYHLTHLRRSAAEAMVIGRSDIWPTLSRLADDGTPVSVIHGTGDPTLSVDRVAQYAQQHPQVNFIPVEGGHNALYRPEVSALIAETVAHQAKLANDSHIRNS